MLACESYAHNILLIALLGFMREAEKGNEVLGSIDIQHTGVHSY